MYYQSNHNKVNFHLKGHINLKLFLCTSTYIFFYNVCIIADRSFILLYIFFDIIACYWSCIIKRKKKKGKMVLEKIGEIKKLNVMSYKMLKHIKISLLFEGNVCPNKDFRVLQDRLLKIHQLTHYHTDAKPCWSLQRR